MSVAHRPPINQLKPIHEKHLPPPLFPPSSSQLIHLDRVDQPVRVLEGGWVVLDVGVARGRLGGAAAAGPDVPGPVAAEGGVEDDVVVGKVGVDVAVAAPVEGDDRGAPVGGHRRPGRDVRGDGASGEKPDVDAAAFPLWWNFFESAMGE